MQITTLITIQHLLKAMSFILILRRTYLVKPQNSLLLTIQMNSVSNYQLLSLFIITPHLHQKYELLITHILTKICYRIINIT